ncbi:methyltransferase, FkbM family [Tistlia consotensis]|uniref:Methyltransferase, FkbM family n=1 Tax=Tistlia consotensis USBA 355 TaxID=560819 RepID=A0A1Y6CJE5_9PROT|nr:FkbM family methyltransferase [Tistlia consotensis]SMF69830.1 methyltransferase, FkbM family [Tistlia consotensis USBA 355]SNS05242.1 methyltransferase, FkbM family [Tistlia consotensis]
MPTSLGRLLGTVAWRELVAHARAAITHPHLLAALIRRSPAPLVERYYAWKDSGRILRARAPAGKVLFVDGGGHLGGGFRFFSSYFPPGRVEYDVFEPNPNCIEPLRRKLAGFDRAIVRLHPAALSTRSGSLRLFGITEREGGPLSTGASVNRHQHSVFYDADAGEALEVPAIDFCDYIRSSGERYDTIVVKLDVEGAENDLLEGLIERDLLRYIDTLYVEFHSFFLKNPRRRAERLRETRLIRHLKDSGTHFRVWH